MWSRDRPSEGVVRVGIPEDFAAYRLTELLSDFVRSRPGLRLDVRCGLSVQSRRALERGELDLALFKRDAGEDGGIAAWPERLHWVTSQQHPIDFRRDPLPLVMSEQGCLYRNRMIHALEAAGRAWHIAYTSPNLRRHPSRGLCRSRREHSARGCDPARASRAQDQGWISDDHQHGSCAGRRRRRKPCDPPPCRGPLAISARPLIRARWREEPGDRPTMAAAHPDNFSHRLDDPFTSPPESRAPGGPLEAFFPRSVI